MFNFFNKKKKKYIQSTFCYCPSCNNELISSRSFVKDDELVYYKCVNCKTESKWYFEAPVPILVSFENK